MHFYDFNIGEYAKKTQHLTNEEDLAYRRALDMYYDTEKPMPDITESGGLATLSRRLRVDEKSLKNVLDEFFPGGINKHAEEKIAAYYVYIAKQQANGKLGGRPKRKESKPTANPPLTQAKPSAKPPLPTTHLPLTTDLEALSGKPDIPPVNGKKKLSEACAEVLEFLNEKTGRHYKPVPANINLIAARLKQGATVVECRQVIAKKCREWRDNPDQEIYLRPKTLFSATNFANYQGEIGQNE